MRGVTSGATEVGLVPALLLQLFGGGPVGHLPGERGVACQSTRPRGQSSAHPHQIHSVLSVMLAQRVHADADGVRHTVFAISHTSFIVRLVL